MYKKLSDGNSRKENPKRSNTICDSPEEALRKFVLNNDIKNINKFIEASPKLLSHDYKPEYKSIILIACSEKCVEPETVKALIDLDADIHFSSKIEEWEALHFAACRTDSRILKVLIDSFKKPEEIDSIAKGCNALHILLRHGTNEDPEEFAECARILVTNGIDVNLGDNNYISPILWAAKKEYKNVIKVILENSSVPVDLDSHQSRKRTARDLITSRQLYDGSLPEKINNTNEKDEYILFKYIQMNNENAFVSFKNGNISKYKNANDTSTTLLQLCCIKGLVKAVNHLLNNGADPNLATKKNPEKPVEIATRSGFYEIFKILLDQPEIQIPKDILITLLKYYDNGCEYIKCYEVLLEKLQSDGTLLDINEPNDSKNSSLHYAVRYSDCERVYELLQLGASLGSKNKNGFMPIHDIEPEVLERHLDDCVECDVKSKKSEREHFAVTFNYRTLIPPVDKIEKVLNDDDPESNLKQVRTQKLVTETEVIYCMSKDPELKHLLQHPVIASFLFIKWHRIRWLFFTNLAFYFALFSSLVTYIFVSYANFNLDRTQPEEGFVVFCRAILIISYFMLVFRELFQMAVAPRKYLKNFENYVEMILIGIAGCIIFISSPSDHLRKQLSSISILLAAFELVLMLGQHPKLSTNVVMLKNVSYNFLKLLIWYSLLIISFAFSFHILFNEFRKPEKQDDLFSDVWKTFFKTIIMTTGELDSGSINFDTYPVLSKIIFGLFIFMIVIILLNLLNGLAVSDTQIIENNAELVGHIARAEHIYYVESMLHGNIIPTNFINKLNENFCCIPRNKNQKYTKLTFLAKSVCIFPHYLNYKMTIYPNQSGRISIPKNKSKKSCVCCSNLYLDQTTVKRTNIIVQARREHLKADHEDSGIQKIKTMLQKLEESIQRDKMEIYMLHTKLDDILNDMGDKSDNN